MPRRKPKNREHLFKPGESGNPNGRPVGSTNEINNAIKTAFAMLLHNQLPNLEQWLAEGAKKDPLKTADILLRVSERFTPALSRTEIVGKDGEGFTPIVIHLPNIPKVSLGVGSAPGESLLTSPVEEVKAIPEFTEAPRGESEIIPDLPEESPGPMGLPSEDSPAEAPPLKFQIPQLLLSPNQLRDLEKQGEVPPALREGTMGDGTR